jgi:hypothetical protein
MISLAFYFPIMKSPFGADDIWMSTLPQRYAYGTESTYGHIVSQLEFWADRGRLMWTGILIETYIFNVLDTRETYKFYLVALNCMVSVSIYFVIVKLGYKRSLAIVGYFLFLALGQFRPFFDPRLHFGGLQQLVSLSIIWVTYFLIRYKQTNKKGYVYPAIVIFLLCAFLYETIVLFSPVWFWILFYQQIGRRIQIKVPALLFLSVVLAFVSLAIWARERASVEVSGYEINLDPTQVLKTFKIQLYGTLPTGSFNGVPTSFSPFDVFRSSPYLVLILLIFLFFLGLSLFRSRVADVVMPVGEFDYPIKLGFVFFMLGTSMLILPAALVSITNRWQYELFPGLPYISVYVQQVGLVIVSLSTLEAAIRKFEHHRKFLTLLILIPSFFLATFTFISNTNLLDAKSPFRNSNMVGVDAFGWDREILDKVLKSPQVSVLIGDERLWFYPQMAWTTTEVVSSSLGKRTEVPNSPDWWTNGNEKIPNGCTASNCRVSDSDLIVLFDGKSYQEGLVAVLPATEVAILSSPDKLDKYVGLNARVLILERNLKANETWSACYVSGGKLERSPINIRQTSTTDQQQPYIYEAYSKRYFDPLSLSRNKFEKC